MMLLENYRTEWTQRERDEIKKMKRERISIRHYGRRVSLCLPSQTGIEKSEGGGGMAKRESQIEIVNINFDEGRGSKGGSKGRRTNGK